MRRSGRHHTEWREFSFSRRSPLSVCTRTTRNLASKQTPTIVEFPPSFNEEPLPAFDLCAVLAGEAGILAVLSHAPHNVGRAPANSGGMRHACKKTFRHRDYRAASQGPSADPRQRHAAPAV